MSVNEVFALVTVVIGAAAQAITGFGFGLVSSPLMILGLGLHNGITLSTLLGITLSTLILSKEWRHANLNNAFMLLVPAIAVTPLAGYIYRNAPASVLSVIAGVLILLGVGALASGFHWHRVQGKLGMTVAGMISGMMGMLANVSGPAIMLYIVHARWDVKTLRPTINIYFLVLGFVAIGVRGLPSVEASFTISLFVAMAVGFAIGSVLTHRVHHRTVRRMSLGLAALGGFAAIIKGLSM